MVVQVRPFDLVERVSVQASQVVSLLLLRPAGGCAAAAAAAAGEAVRAVVQIR